MTRKACGKAILSSYLMLNAQKFLDDNQDLLEDIEDKKILLTNIAKDSKIR